MLQKSIIYLYFLVYFLKKDGDPPYKISFFDIKILSILVKKFKFFNFIN